MDISVSEYSLARVPTWVSMSLRPTSAFRFLYFYDAMETKVSYLIYGTRYP